MNHLIEQKQHPSAHNSGKTLLKIIGIGYLTEYSASVATDAGCASVAQKLQLGGKIVIFLMSISIVTALVDVVTELTGLI